MGNFILNKDIHLLCVRAISFPDGIKEAFKKLEQIDTSVATRNIYGISHEGEDGIMYWAAAEESFKGEAHALGLEQFVIRKGTYTSQVIKDLKGNEQKIGDAFHVLLQHPKLDLKGACVECYKSDTEVRCIVRLIE